MRRSHSAWDPSAATRVWSPRSSPAHAVIVAGVATLLFGTATVAADSPDPESARVADAAAEAGPGPTPHETEAHATSSVQQTDRERGTEAKEHKRGGKEHKANLASETESAAALPGAALGMAEQKCSPTRITGTHIWKIVCISPAQQQANDKYDEQQAKDYLRRLSQQGSIAPAIPNRYTTAGPF